MKSFADSFFWRALSVAAVFSVFYFGYQMGRSGEENPMLPAASAHGMIRDGVERVWTSSPDGSILYMWDDIEDGDWSRTEFQIVGDKAKKRFIQAE